MTTTTRAAFAACLFVGIVAGSLAPRVASAHAELTEDEALRPSRIHVPEAPTNLRVEGAAGRPDIAVRVSWTPGHSHERFGYFWITLATIPLPSHPFEAWELNCITRNRSSRHVSAGTDHCIRLDVRSGRSSYSETVSGLTPETTYYVHVAETYLVREGIGYGSTATITTEPASPDTETPTDPETPPEPETPDPEAPDCTYEHRITGVSGTTANAYTGWFLVSSKEPNATATLRAFQADNGHPIDVLDAEGSAVGSATSLAPAHSVKRFQLEGVRGWHTVIVEHPTARAMRRATVSLMLRGPDVGVSVVPVQGIEDCTPAATTTE